MSTSEDALRSAGGRVGPADDRPLTEQEFQLLQRLLSDPFSFPIQYKTWLVSYLETSDLSLPISAIQGLTNILGIAGVGGGTLGILPAGIILPFGGVSAPQGSLMCNGASYSRVVQERLWKAIGGAYGTPDANTFNVPDMQERIPVGRGVMSALDTVGKNEGLALGSRGVRHYHSGGSHTHTLGREVVSLTPGQTAYSITGNQLLHDGGSVTDSASIGVIGPPGTPLDGPAFLVINFIIVN